MKNEYARLKAAWGGDTEYDGWFAHQVNNAGLNSVAAYYDFVPGFDRLLAQNGGELEKYYAAAKAISKKTKKERHEALKVLAKEATPGSEAEGVSETGH